MLENNFRKKMIGVFVLAGLVATGVWYFRKPKAFDFENQPLVVSYYTVSKGSVQQKENFPGKVRTLESVILSSDVVGRIVFLLPDGSKVKKGDLVAALDSSEAYGRYVSSKGAMEKERSKKDSAKILFDEGFQSKNHLLGANADYDVALGRFLEAKSHLEKYRIVAPFDGVIGLQKQNLGAVVTSNTPLVSVTNYKKMQVEFSIPEAVLFSLGGVDSIKNSQIYVRLEGDLVPIEALFLASDGVIDQSTNSVAVRVSLDSQDADREIKPGHIAQVSVDTGIKKDIIVVPVSALLQAQGSSFVYKIVNGIVVQTLVRVGTKDESFAEILEGLSQGDEIVSGGFYRLNDGQPVIKEETEKGEGK
jgi:membrane fusion protein (multidrug efflux system)